jgi:hypothetical protein
MSRADDNEGHIVSQRVKENLKLTAYMIKYQKKLSLVHDFDTITLDNVCSMISIREFEEIYENHEPPPMRDVQDPTKLQEQLDNYLCFTNREMNRLCRHWQITTCQQSI